MSAWRVERRARGFSVLETLVALAITGLTVSALATVLNRLSAADVRAARLESEARSVDRAQRAVELLLSSATSSGAVPEALVTGDATSLSVMGSGTLAVVEFRCADEAGDGRRMFAMPNFNDRAWKRWLAETDAHMPSERIARFRIGRSEEAGLRTADSQR